ncbi:ABC transporter ATP-binding protein [bacterium]|nr:ABC transporter ATP-binding protein [bacterium]
MLAVRAQNLTYQYPDGTTALNGVQLEIREGEKVAVIGPNGSGKSTLLTLFNGVRKGEGTLQIFGHKVNKKNIRMIKKMVGLVFQNPDDQLFCPTIFEDVSFGPLNLGFDEAEIREKVKAALDDVGLNGYETRSSFHLSFGERKLASIATVLAMDPDLIAMDEPTSNLDLAHRRRIIQWIQQNPNTIVLTSHDLDMILETCQRIILLNRGRIVADDTADTILRDQSLLEANDLELPVRFQI